MTVRKLSAHSYYVDVSFGRDCNGKRIRRKKTCKVKSEAELLDAQWNLERQIHDGTVSGDLTFAEFVNAIYWPQKHDAMRATTRKGYKRDIKLRLMPSFANVSIGKINRLNIQNMLSNCATKKVAENARETLSAILTVAVEMEMISRNPASYTYVYPEAGKHDVDHYGVWLTTFAEHVALLEWVHGHYENLTEERMIVVGLCFGLRKGEILALDWENVDLRNRQIRISQTYTSAEGKPVLTEPKTERSKRIVPMTEYAYQRFSSWNLQSKNEDVNLNGDVCHPVICGVGGKRMSPKTASDKIARMRKDKLYDNGTPVPRITLYSLRHSFATACINAGMEVSKVSAMLGHADTAVTYNRYVKPKLKDIKQETTIIDAAFEKASKG